jgi:hypothetical protein
MSLTTGEVQRGRRRKKILSFPWLLGLSACLFALPVRAQTAATGGMLSFPLNFAEKESSLSTTLEVGKQEVRFRKEPDFGKDRILRRALKVGPGKDDFIGFAVNLTRRNLYLDLNQNLDLTDDPQGVFQAQEGGLPIFFRNIRLNLHKNGIDRSYVLNPLYFYAESSYYMAIESSYRGEIELHGEKWRLEVQDNLDGEINLQDQFSITRAASSGEAGGGAPTYSGMQVPVNLFLGGHQYRLSFGFGAESDVSQLMAGFTEISSPLGELVLDGQFVQRLVLQGNGLVILDSPTQPLPVPADKYRVQAIYLQSPPSTMVFAARDVSRFPEFSVTAGASYHLRAGGPLESRVAVASRGNSLGLNYVLTGVAGESYTASNPGRKNPPKFSIYQGDRQLAAGNFEYG